MAAADAIVSDKEHLERTTSHFNALLEDKPRQGGEQDDRDALKLMNRLFAATGKAMESDADRRRLALLKKYMGCLIGTSLGVDAFLPEEAKDDQNDGEEEDDQEEQQAGGRSWADIAQKQSSADKSFIIRQTRSFAADAAAARRERAHVRQWVKQCAYQSAEEEEQHFKGGFEPEYLPESSNFCMPLFFPSEQSYHTFITALKSAEETLYVCIFSLTDNTTARAIRDAHRRGVDVRIITDNEQLDNRGSDIMRLKEEEDIPTKQDNGYEDYISGLERMKFIYDKYIEISLCTTSSLLLTTGLSSLAALTGRSRKYHI